MYAFCIFGLIQLRYERIDQPLCLTITTEWIIAYVNLLDFIPSSDQAMIDSRQIVIVQKQLKHKQKSKKTNPPSREKPLKFICVMCIGNNKQRKQQMKLRYFWIFITNASNRRPHTVLFNIFARTYKCIWMN